MRDVLHEGLYVDNEGNFFVGWREGKHIYNMNGKQEYPVMFLPIELKDLSAQMMYFSGFLNFLNFKEQNR